MDKLKKIVDMVADKNYIWVIITTLGKEPLIHTAHNGKWRVSELQGDLKTIVDYMVENHISQIANYSYYTAESWKNSSLVMFDGDEKEEKEIIKRVISIFGAKYNKTDDGKYVMNEWVDGIRYHSMVSGKSYEVA
ncbi:hypothetical protein [Phascolarctobacterium succinatutens]|uniref:hypothetical protein n=1 Tax=Phascolarctobacterium succinatutens TaxID=626940 RepID=UPI003AB359D2